MIYRKVFSCLIILHLLNVLRCTAQPNTVRNLGIEQGLSNNLVNCIIQDTQGFIWIGTNDGLNKYDGYNFSVFRKKLDEPISLADNLISTLAVDPNNNLWVGTAKGVNVIQLKTETILVPRYHEPESNVSRNLTLNIQVNHQINGYMLVGSIDSGLIVFAPNSLEGTLVPLREKGWAHYNYGVNAIANDGEVAWVNIEYLGLARLDLNKRELVIVNRNLGIRCICPDHKGSIWVGDANGIYKYDIASNTYSTSYIPTAKKIVSLHLEDNGNLWVGTDGNGLYIVNTNAANAVNTPIVKQELNSNSVFTVFQDKESRKWIGTLRGGVSVIENKPKIFNAIVDLHPLSPESNFVLSLCENPDKSLWVGTDGGGLKLWDRKTDNFKDFISGNSDKTVSSNFITGINDYLGYTWIATWFGGINRYDNKAGRFERYSLFDVNKNISSNNVWFLYEDHSKKLWAKASGTLQVLNRKTNHFELYDKDFADVQCMSEDKTGQLWAGTFNSLVKIDTLNKKHHNYPVSYTIRSIHADIAGLLWVGTDGGGLFNFNPKTGVLRQFTTKDGLSNNSVLRILEDSKKILWLSTFNGLNRFDPVDEKFISYDQSDGLKSTQFSYNAAVMLRSGELAFGGIKGFTIFNPDNIKTSVYIPPVFLTGYSFYNKPSVLSAQIDKNEKLPLLEIKYDSAAIAFYFSAPEYAAPQK